MIATASDALVVTAGEEELKALESMTKAGEGGVPADVVEKSYGFINFDGAKEAPH